MSLARAAPPAHVAPAPRIHVMPGEGPASTPSLVPPPQAVAAADAHHHDVQPGPRAKEPF